MRMIQLAEDIVFSMILTIVAVALVFSAFSVFFPIGKLAQRERITRTIELQRSLDLLPAREEQ